MNYISTCNHPESYLSGSTIESMVKRTQDLGLDYLAITDHGYMSSVLRGYMCGQNQEKQKKPKVKVIAGVEIYFKDSDCPIILNTASQNIKYFKLVIHAIDQAAYQRLATMCSDTTKKKVYVAGNKHHLFTWKDLEELSKMNITVSNSNVEDMVSKHLLVNRADLGLQYYQRLLGLFGDRFYPAIVPYKYDKYWNMMVEVKLNNKTYSIPAQDRVETDHYEHATAVELTRRGNRHKKLLYIYVNKVRYKVAPEFQDIQSAKAINQFQDMPSGDIQTKANRFIMALAAKFGQAQRLLINNYAYYAEEGDKVVQDMKLGEDKRIDQAQHMRSLYDVTEYLEKELGFTDKAIKKTVENTHTWANLFKDFELKYDYRLPEVSGSPEQKLMEIIKSTGRMKWDNPEYVKQFREEWQLLTQNGVLNLIPYFLPIVDVYNFYKDNGFLTGPARGSAGGFLLSYVMGVTHIDPIKYGLYSSRFLTMDRVQQGNLPDIDCDLESRVPLVGKDGASGYLYNRYGNKAAQVSTRTLLRIKSAILDASRFINGGKVTEEATALAKSLPNTPQGVSDQDYVFGYTDKEGTYHKGLLERSDALQKYAVDHPQEWEIVKRALSLARQCSRHACAFVVADKPIEQIVPVFDVGGVSRVTQPEAKQCEFAGLIKYDFLVVSSVKDIRLCLDYINEKNNSDIETGYFVDKDKKTFIWDLPEDPEVFRMLSLGKTETVFQLNTVSVTPFVKRIQPKNIIDCATITSLVRPGPLDFKDKDTGRNMVEEYTLRRHGQSVGTIKVLNEMLPETYGVLVFQEQVTKLAKELAGMDVIDAENVRIAVGKKKKKLIESLKPKFIEGASKKVDLDTATTIWNMMETFARYGFNKSHAVAYSVISYACAYLKHHYPLEWWAAVLSNAPDKEINETFYQYVKDMVLPPDVNLSTERMSIDYSIGKIRNKLSMISGIGTKAAEKIIAGRPYSGIQDFVDKKVCGQNMARKLIHVGVLDSLFESQDTLLTKMKKFEDSVEIEAFNSKLNIYDIKISQCKDGVSRDKMIASKKKYHKKGPKPSIINDSYIGLTPIKEYQIKKSIFPIMNLDLNKIIVKYSNNEIIKGPKFPIISNNFGEEFPLLTGEQLQHVDNTDLQKMFRFCVPAYVIDVSEFTYQKGSKVALKLNLDSSGYVSEKVLWPNYDTGILEYSPELKKGAVCFFFYYKKPGKPYTNIVDIKIESPAI